MRRTSTRSAAPRGPARSRPAAPSGAGTRRSGRRNRPGHGSTCRTGRGAPRRAAPDRGEFGATGPAQAGEPAGRRVHRQRHQVVARARSRSPATVRPADRARPGGPGRRGSPSGGRSTSTASRRRNPTVASDADQLGRYGRAVGFVGHVRRGVGTAGHLDQHRLADREGVRVDDDQRERALLGRDRDLPGHRLDGPVGRGGGDRGRVAVLVARVDVGRGDRGAGQDVVELVEQHQFPGLARAPPADSSTGRRGGDARPLPASPSAFSARRFHCFTPECTE